MIRTAGLTKRYKDTLAVDGISFEVQRGQVFGFLGPNGSGKTTTIGMLLGIISPTGGGFALFGGETPGEIHAARQWIGATLEYPNFYPYLSCRDNLRLVARVKGLADTSVDRALDEVGLARRQKTRFKACSLGMKQRLALAATMIGEPELIILDEPANGLDPEGMREIREIIAALAERGVTIFLSSHLLDEVQKTCTHVAIIRSGRLLRQAPLGELTSATPVAVLRGGDSLESLRSATAEYPHATSVRVVDESVHVGLDQPDLAGLNRFLGERGVFLSHLSLEARRLEDVFLEVTGAPEDGFGEVS